MPNKVLIEAKKELGYKIGLNPDFAGTLGIKLWKYSILRFGFKVVEVEIELSNEIKYEGMTLYSDIVKELRIPFDCSYEIKVSDGEIIIGPFIGILAATTDKEITNRFKWLSNFTKDYDRINGAIFAFSTESIDKEQMLIKGFLYSPLEKKWVKKRMCFPTALYINARLEKKEREYLKSLYGPKLFNYRTLNKWEIHRLLENSADLRGHLPETYLYDNPKTLSKLLDKYKKVYMKPLSGYGGEGLMRFTAVSNQIVLQYREKETNIKMAFFDKESLESYLSINKKAHKSLVQQALDLEHIDKRVSDIRVAWNKDQHGKWKCSGIVARTGIVDSVVSNYSSGGSVESFESTLHQYFNLDQNELPNIRNKVISLTEKIIHQLEQSGQYFGKLAIDIGIDRDFHIWIIEVNNRSPNDFLFAHAGDRETTFQIKLDNMLYAKWLAGFGIETESEDLPLFKKIL